MKAAIVREFGKALEVTDVPDPTPHDDGVVLKVSSTGICRSDWHAWQGHDPDIKELPHVPGHELAGEIVAIGKNVRRWMLGDCVTVPFAAGCGKCPSCSYGDTHICDHQYQPGFTGWGSFAEYVGLRYADLNLVRIPEEMTTESAAAIGCRFSTAYRALIQQGRAMAGDWAVIFGCGGVGLSCIMIARAFGIQTIAVDIRDESLSLAKQYGSSITINSSSSDNLSQSIHDITKGGAHVTIDAIGNAKVIMEAMMSLRKRGRHVQVGLMTGRDIISRIPIARMIAWELELLGSHGLPIGGFSELVDLIIQGKLRPQDLIQKRIDLSEVPDALQAMTGFQDSGITMLNFAK